ncbi:MAG: hypothetical protein J5995_10475 [Muribaculaceae bacterium]|nr:hypothetical protein [Muribaculaceae bacterium]
MKTLSYLTNAAVVLLASLTFLTSEAQNSAPAPGSGGAFTPAPPSGPGGPVGPGFGPAVPPPMWGTGNSMMNGGPWGPGAFSGPYYNNGPGFNSGVSRVVAVGYDAQGVWETVPMVVHWDWNGFFYDFTVRDAWNPWTRMWETDLGIPAFQTDYTLRGVTYDYYVNLSTGTYYFNP